MKNKFSKILVALGSFFFFIHILTFLGEMNWLFDTLSHFKLQYFVILLIITLLSLIINKNQNLQHTVVLSSFTLILAVEVFGIFAGGRKDTKLENYFKLVSINLLTQNTQYQATRDYINQTDADLLILLESSQVWIDNLTEVTSQYPYKEELARDDNFGICLYSKYQIDSINIFYKEKLGSSISAFFEYQGKQIKIIALHPKPPLNYEYFTFRNDFFKNIINEEKNRDYELILAGDFNMSSYSVNFKFLIEQLNLTDSRKGFGWLHTWHYIPIITASTIDHCLISDKLKIRDRKIGDNIGSDHKPIYIEIGF